MLSLVCCNISASWLQDFYLDLVEDNKRITPRDYLELALRPVQGSGRDIGAKNEVLSNSSFSAERLHIERES